MQYGGFGDQTCWNQSWYIHCKPRRCHDFSFTLMASGVPFRSYCMSSIGNFLLYIVMFVSLWSTWACKTHDVSSKRCIFFLDKAWKSTTIFWKIKNTLTKTWVFRKPTGLSKKVAKDFPPGTTKTADSVGFFARRQATKPKPCFALGTGSKEASLQDSKVWTVTTCGTMKSIGTLVGCFQK